MAFGERKDFIETNSYFSPTEYVGSILSLAAEKKASDVHLEPMKIGARVLFRIDGTITEVDRISSENLAGIVNALKVMASLDFGSLPVPHDGYFPYNRPGIDGYSHSLDVRLSIFPVVYGMRW